MAKKDVGLWNWDDSTFCRAYEMAWKSIKDYDKENREREVENREREVENSSPPEEIKRHKWKVDDYCKAVYSGDGSYYEAKIVYLNGDVCTVEFLGYGDIEDVDLLELKESGGKKARKQQIKLYVDETFDYNITVGETRSTTDGSVASYSSYKKKKRHAKKPSNNATLDTTMYEATFHQQYSAPPPVTRIPPSSMPTILPPPAPMPQNSVPPVPPMMPQCSSLADDPSISSLLTAWYMAGYYTGFAECECRKPRM